MRKTIILVVIGLFLFGFIGVPVEAKTYNAITEDDQVASKEDVQVEEVETVERKTVYTLKSINLQLEDCYSRIDDILTTIENLESLKILIDNEACKVKLKPSESEPEPDHESE